MNCAVCYNRDISVVLDMGDVALAGAFLKESEFGEEKTYPLRLGMCRSCLTVQVIDRVDPQALFGRYFYRSSTSAAARAYFARYAEELVQRFKPKKVIEVGCNDGAMLRHLAGRVEEVVGVDPSEAAAVHIHGADIWRDRFTQTVARSIRPADLIVANNVFAHVEGIGELVQAVRAGLNPKGVFVFECHYLGAVLDGQYDAIYHEHVFYHSLLSLQRLFSMWGMEVFDVQPIARHGGSMRYYACKRGAYAVRKSVDALAQQESARGFHSEESYKRLAVSMLDHRRHLMGILNRLKRERAVVAGYGAAGRANSLMQWCGIDSLTYVADDCQAKHGYYTPGTHFPVVPPSLLQQERPDYVLVLAWTYFGEIARKVTAPLIVPFPKPEIVTGVSLEAA